MLSENIPWVEQQQPANAAAKIGLLKKRLWLPVPVPGCGIAGSRGATVRLDVVIVKHAILLPLKVRGAANLATKRRSSDRPSRAALLSWVALRQRNTQNEQKNETKQNVANKRSVGPAIVLPVVACNRQRKAEYKRVTTYRPKCSDRALKRGYNRLDVRLRTKLLSRGGVSDTKSLTSRRGVGSWLRQTEPCIRQSERRVWGKSHPTAQREKNSVLEAKYSKWATGLSTERLISPVFLEAETKGTLKYAIGTC